MLQGGALRTGKMVVFDATLSLVAQDGGALVIDPARMDDQIADGIARNSKDGDVTVYVVAPGDAPVNPMAAPPEGPEEPRTPPEKPGQEAPPAPAG